MQCVGRYRLGGHHLAGRLPLQASQGPRQPQCQLCCEGRRDPEWPARVLARCGSVQQEDLRHFLLECPVFDHLCDMYPHMFTFSPLSTATACMLSVLAHPQQVSVARCIAAMDAYRAHLLGKHSVSGVRFTAQRQSYLPLISYPPCLLGR
jgi:hypothetical protein